MAVQFCPGKLGEKLDSLMHRVDYYLKGEDRDYVHTNPQNLHLVFTQEQLATSLCVMRLQPVASDAAALVDVSVPILDAAAIIEDIKTGLSVDPLAKWELDLCLKGSLST